MHADSGTGSLSGKPSKEEKRIPAAEHKNFMFYILCAENLKRKVKNLE